MTVKTVISKRNSLFDQIKYGKYVVDVEVGDLTLSAKSRTFKRARRLKDLMVEVLVKLQARRYLRIKNMVKQHQPLEKRWAKTKSFHTIRVNFKNNWLNEPSNLAYHIYENHN